MDKQHENIVLNEGIQVKRIVLLHSDFLCSNNGTLLVIKNKKGPQASALLIRHQLCIQVIWDIFFKG